MILGIGTDIVDMRRVQAILTRHREKVKDRLFTDKEQKRCMQRVRVFDAFAKIFAAKEAVFKSIGSIQGAVFLDVEITPDKNGQPQVALQGLIAKKAESLCPPGFMYHFSLSISDESPYALAFVVLEARVTPF